VTAFFVPGLDALAEDAEHAYSEIRDEASASMGRAPQPERIFKLWFRHEGADLEAEVGKPDPVRGDTVLAILDLGRSSPYLIYCRTGAGSATQMTVSKPVYDVTEFS
jgi:rhodanese-related sulfurtransferase